MFLVHDDEHATVSVLSKVIGVAERVLERKSGGDALKIVQAQDGPLDIAARRIFRLTANRIGCMRYGHGFTGG